MVVFYTNWEPHGARMKLFFECHQHSGYNFVDGAGRARRWDFAVLIRADPHIWGVGGTMRRPAWQWHDCCWKHCLASLWLTRGTRPSLFSPSLFLSNAFLLRSVKRYCQPKKSRVSMKTSPLWAQPCLITLERWYEQTAKGPTVVGGMCVKLKVGTQAWVHQLGYDCKENL